MNSWTPQENKMRQLAEGHSAQPPGFVWDNISAELDKNKKTNFKPFPGTMLILLLACLGILFYLSDKNSVVLKGFNTPVTQTREINSSANKEFVSAQLQEDKNSPADENAYMQDIPAKTNDKVPASGIKAMQEKVYYNNVNNKNLNELTKRKSKSLNSKLNQGNSLFVNSAVNNKRNYLKANYPVSGISGETNSPGSAPSSLRNIPAEEASTREDIKILSGKISDAEDHNKLNNTGSLSSVLESNNIMLLDYLHDREAKHVVSAENPEILLTGNPQCPTFSKKKKTSFFADLSGGIGFPLKYMKAGVENRPYLDTRKSTESPLYLWSGTLRAGISYRENWTFSAGLNHLQVREKFSYERPGVIRTVITTYPNGDSDTSVVRGTEVYESSPVHRLFSIPVIVGYQHPVGNWILGAEAGINWNISLQSEGRIMTPAGNVERVQDNTVYYKKSLGLGLTGGLMVQYKLLEKAAVYLRPSVTYYPASWNATNYVIDQKYALPEVQAGFRFTF